MSATDAGDLVARYMKTRGMTQTVVAHELTRELRARGSTLTVEQPHVSDHLRGNRWNMDLPGAYIAVLDIPPEEMMRAWGWVDATVRPRTVAAKTSVPKPKPNRSAG